MFIFFHRTTFGVAKASVCFREAATKTVELNKTTTQQKVRVFSYTATDSTYIQLWRRPSANTCSALHHTYPTLFLVKAALIDVCTETIVQIRSETAEKHLPLCSAQLFTSALTTSRL